MTRRRATAFLTAAALGAGVAGCNSGDSSGSSSSTGSTATSSTSTAAATIPVMPGTTTTWKGRKGAWQGSTPGWSPARDSRAVQAGGRVWYLAVDNASNQRGLASFSATKPAKVTVTPLPWQPGNDESNVYRIAAVDGVAVVFHNNGKDLPSPTYQAVTGDPATGRISPTYKTAFQQVGDDGQYLSVADPAVILEKGAGDAKRFSPKLKKWVPSTKASRGGAALTTIGSTPVEWVGPGTGKAGEVWVGGKRVNLTLNPAPDPAQTGPTDLVYPLIVTDVWALLAVSTPRAAAGQPTSRVFLVRPGSSTATPVPVPALWGLDTDAGEMKSAVKGRTGVTTFNSGAITVNTAGKVTVTRTDAPMLSAFDGQRAYLDTVDNEGGEPVATEVPVAGPASVPNQQSAIAPLVVTDTGAAVFNSRQRPEDPTLDRIVFVPAR